MERAAQRAQAVVDNLNHNVLKDATPQERAAAERYHRLRRECGLKSLEAFALRQIVDDLRVPQDHRAIARTELDRREAELERLLAGSSPAREP